MWPHNDAALGLYLSRGFVVEGRLRAHYRRANGQVWDAIVMGLILDPELTVSQPASVQVLGDYLGVLGPTGLTAYFGLLDVGRPKAGDTVLVSAAAGAVGSVVGQIAKMQGCRVVGMAGTDDKCRWLEEDLGFDAVINYKQCGDYEAAIRVECPKGVDVYFDNVGGPVLNAMLVAMKVYGRIVGCGMISDYNRTENPNPITNLWEVVARQLTMQGFLLFTYHNQVPAAQAQLTEWINQGKIKVIEHITKGIANTPAAFCELMSGKTTGKALVEVDLIELT